LFLTLQFFDTTLCLCVELTVWQRSVYNWSKRSCASSDSQWSACRSIGRRNASSRQSISVCWETRRRFVIVVITVLLCRFPAGSMFFLNFFTVYYSLQLAHSMCQQLL